MKVGIAESFTEYVQIACPADARNKTKTDLHRVLRVLAYFMPFGKFYLMQFYLMQSSWGWESESRASGFSKPEIIRAGRRASQLLKKLYMSTTSTKRVTLA